MGKSKKLFIIVVGRNIVHEMPGNDSNSEIITVNYQTFTLQYNIQMSYTQENILKKVLGRTMSSRNVNNFLLLLIY